MKGNDALSKYFDFLKSFIANKYCFLVHIATKLVISFVLDIFRREADNNVCFLRNGSGVIYKFDIYTCVYRSSFTKGSVY